MDHGEWITALRKLGVLLREMFIIGEGDNEGEPLMIRMKELRDELELLIKGLEDSSSIIRIMRTQVFPESGRTKHRIREEITQFSFGPAQEEVVTLDISIVIDDKEEQTTVRGGSISINPRMHHHTCPGCESMTRAEYHENNLCVIDQIVAQLGFPSLARTTIWTFSAGEIHPLLTAFERHWADLQEACIQQEYRIGKDEILVIIGDGNPVEFSKQQLFAVEFVIKKELELYDTMEEIDKLPNCNCDVRIHKEKLLAWKTRNIPE